MLGVNRVHLALALVTAAAVGCGGGGETMGTGGSGGQGGSTASSSTASSASSSSNSGTSSSSGEAPVRASSGWHCPSGKGTVLAASKLAFGEGNSGEWKKFGFDLDGLVSTSGSKDVCKLNSGGSASTAYPDGDQGIDNSFGKNLLPTILSLYPTWVSDINADIQKGDFTGLVELECLPATGDVPSFTTKLFGGKLLGMAPKWDGTDKWPVEPELLADSMDPQSSTILFPKSSVKGTTFDSGKNVTFILTVPVKTMTDSTSIKLTLHAAQMVMTLSEDRKSATAGMIGGVLDTEEFVAEVKKVGALLGICGTSLFDGLVTQIRQASDIMNDGTQDPSQTCNGISMGLGFEMKEAQIGVVGSTTPAGAACN